MNFEETLSYLYAQLPMYQRVGAAAMKKDLTNTWALMDVLQNPQTKFKSIHIAGTNGKGSTAHMLAACLQSAGYRVGLYTSPHLKCFTERIRLNGVPVTKSYVVNFVEKHRQAIEKIQPSFFEITVAMAFDYFAQEEVDFAVIETGLGGRLDSTNVLNPLLSVITRIGLDHKDMLGDTLPKIAAEKAGIIKPKTPVVVSTHQPETDAVFERFAKEKDADIYFGEDVFAVKPSREAKKLQIFKGNKSWSRTFLPNLQGNYQFQNYPGVLQALSLFNEKGWGKVEEKDILHGLENVTPLTGLKGRWQKLADAPLTFADTGHNEDAIRLLVAQIESYAYKKLHLVLGVANDKDLSAILPLFPAEANYYFCKPQVPRGLAAEALQAAAAKLGRKGERYANVNLALEAAQQQASEDDFIFVGGSTFTVADIEGL